MDKLPPSDRFGYKSSYRRNLPHIQPVGADLFVTFRLAGSLPQNVLEWMAEERAWREEIHTRINKPSRQVIGLARRHFVILEKCLDKCHKGSHVASTTTSGRLGF
jgi:putative transposase